MAGGPNAEHVYCMVCLSDDRQLTKATRVHEGVEGDQYVCEKGHEFGLDWPEPAEEPQWPAPQEIIDAVNESN